MPVDGIANTATGSVLVDSSTLDVSGNGVGKLTLQGGDITINYSDLLADNTGKADASANQGVTIFADNLKLDNRTHISATTNSSGDGGSVTIHSGTIQFDNSSHIDAGVWSNAKGNAGNIIIKANRDLTLQNDSYISADTIGKGNAGTVDVEATGTMQLLAEGRITSVSTSSEGDSGSVKVTAESLKIDGSSSGINADATNSTGHAGAIDVQIVKDIEIFNGGDISTNSNGSSPTGNITVIADTLTIDGQGKSTGISSTGSDHENISKMSITTNGAMEILNGGQISADAFGGAGGNINIEAGSLKIDSQGGFSTTGISSIALGTGRAGDIRVESSGAMEILNKGEILADTLGSGNGGNIKVITDSLKIDGTGTFLPIGISSKTHGSGSKSGKAGNITAVSYQVDYSNNGRSVGRNKPV